MSNRFDVFYWRMSGEVDFVILRDGVPTPVQVTAEGAAERHWRSLDAFYETFPHAAEAVIVPTENFADVFDLRG